MGIYIKGMEMPTGERPVHIEIHRDGTVIQWKFNESDEIIGTAVEVPTPHGDLIDQGTAVEVAMEWCPDDDGSVGKIGDLRDLLDEIEALPTIIEAEEEK